MLNKPTFSLIGHPPNTSLLQDYLKFLKPEYSKKRMKEGVLRAVFCWTPAFKAFDVRAKRSETGEKINGIFVLSTFFPDMLF